MSRLDLTKPDDLGAFIGKTLASFVSGNNQPDMSGDDRNRIRHPHIRERYDRSCIKLAAEILSAQAAASQVGIGLLADEPKDPAMIAATQQPVSEGVGATGAQAVVRDGQIVISIDVDALPVIVSGSCATMGAMQGLWKVTDAAEFAKAVCMSLNDEREDGTTRVHTMFDGAFMHAIEQGAEGIEEVGEEEFEAECGRLHWSSNPIGEEKPEGERP